MVAQRPPFAENGSNARVVPAIWRIVEARSLSNPISYRNGTSVASWAHHPFGVFHLASAHFRQSAVGGDTSNKRGVCLEAVL